MNQADSEIAVTAADPQRLMVAKGASVYSSTDDGRQHACLYVDVDRFGVMSDNLGLEGEGFVHLAATPIPRASPLSRLSADTTNSRSVQRAAIRSR